MLANDPKDTAAPALTPVFAKAVTWLPSAVLEVPAKQPSLFLYFRIAALFSVFLIVDFFIMRDVGTEELLELFVCWKVVIRQELVYQSDAAVRCTV